jgi:Tfp pilus assembly protein PilF
VKASRRRWLLLAGLLIAAARYLGATLGAQGDPGGTLYRPKLRGSQDVERFRKYVEPGADAFPEERDAQALQARLAALGAALRASPDRAPDIASLLAPDFRGGRLAPPDAERTAGAPALEIRKARSLPAELVYGAREFPAALRRLVEDLRGVAVAEFQITSIEVEREARVAKTDVRYDIVGPGRRSFRAQHVGVWRMNWREDASGWRVVEWAGVSETGSRAAAPVFTEITRAALGANESFRRQLDVRLDDWSASLDSVLARDSNGHHGVSVGDADGDGLDDLYVSQPAGLPNRLLRNRGDSTFEDITESAGVGVLDDTSQALFADVDNDGDQDLILATAAGPMLFLNDGHGHFTHAKDAFRLDRPLQGVLTSMTMADYDRDGFLDLYLCVYSYLYGAGEDKAGTPMPYYDARNGPPAVLLRNDGHGHFVDVTREAGLEASNDRYHFAAAWADYDGDGWPDLLVANDFGTKNLYRNRGRGKDGKVTFEEVSAAAGVLDHGAGMSATFFDYDNDGRLDIYTGNIWSATGLRVTSAPGFMPELGSDVRSLYRRHARGNSLLRNRGDGHFEDVSVQAGAEMGRWAWCSDAFDFDSDGWDDLYVVNGMLTRDDDAADLDGFFWRQVVARSPRTRVTGTPYDDAWRAMNQLLIKGSIASHQRNVFLRNDGRGGFDDVSGSVGLDLDQDGRSFAVLDVDRDGDPDLVVMAPRQRPQLRVFRNDYKDRGHAIALRLSGTASNRDAVGARVTAEADGLRRTRIVTAGTGFLSQHSKELLIGLGPSQRVRRLTVEWPSGRKQAFEDVAVERRYRLEEGGELRGEPFAVPKPLAEIAARAPASPPSTTWLFEPFPAPDFALRDLRGQEHSLAALRGRPALILLWSAREAGSREALLALARAHDGLAEAGVGAIAVALEPDTDLAEIGAIAGTLPVFVASDDVAKGYAILNRHIYMNRQDLRLPAAFLLDAAGRVVKAYRNVRDFAAVPGDSAQIDAVLETRLARALPFTLGTFYGATGQRNYLPYGHELLDQGLEAAAVVAFERAAQASPSPSTLYRLGTLLAKSGQPASARGVLERALSMQPELSEASNDLGALLAQEGNLSGAIERFQAALRAAPEYPDALNNLGYALLLSGRDQEARERYEQALKLQPDFPEALNNLGMLLGRAGELEAAEPYFRRALGQRDDYGDAANNLALVLAARGKRDDAIALLRAFVAAHPEQEASYVALAKLYLSAGDRGAGVQVLERLLQRNPRHAEARELLRRF